MKRIGVTQTSVVRAHSAVLGWVVTLALALTSGCGTWQAAKLYQSGSRALDSGALELAVADLESAAKLEPARSEIRNHLGLAYVAAGDVGAAERAFEAAIALDCENAAARRNLEALNAGELGVQAESARSVDPEAQ
ncbi:MAG: hypothetical protein VX246_12670 [Myxococcota bacterium]|nr:hypothetical protein [Myxococcota bacterium]